MASDGHTHPSKVTFGNEPGDDEAENEFDLAQYHNRYDASSIARRWLSRPRRNHLTSATVPEENSLSDVLAEQDHLIEMLEASHHMFDQSPSKAADHVTSLVTVIRKQQLSFLQATRELSRLQHQLRIRDFEISSLQSRTEQLQIANISPQPQVTTTSADTVVIKDLREKVEKLQTQLREMPTHEMVQTLRYNDLHDCSLTALLVQKFVYG